ncbi:MAG: hypothetical protein DRN78_00545 [Thermoproteota archaeon]|nr:MAG: hypothetical protein DRN78_00545 [Candidatus Korarchaeota archaeon]
MPDNIVIDTGPLLLPLTREPGWDKVRKLLVMHERGEITLHVGLFNIAELVSAMHKLGYDMEVSLRYATLISEKMNVINDIQYTMWMGKLRIKAHQRRYNIPWGDLSSAAAAISLDLPVLILDEDKHFDQIMTICNELENPIQIIRVKNLMS